MVFFFGAAEDFSSSESSAAVCSLPCLAPSKSRRCVGANDRKFARSAPPDAVQCSMNRATCSGSGLKFCEGVVSSITGLSIAGACVSEAGSGTRTRGALTQQNSVERHRMIIPNGPDMNFYSDSGNAGSQSPGEFKSACAKGISLRFCRKNEPRGGIPSRVVREVSRND